METLTLACFLSTVARVSLHAQGSAWEMGTVRLMFLTFSTANDFSFKNKRLDFLNKKISTPYPSTEEVSLKLRTTEPAVKKYVQNYDT